MLIRHGPGEESHLIVSFHGVTSRETGIWAASAFIVLGANGDSARTEACCTEPFTFTADRDSKDLRTAYEPWLEGAVTFGLEIWRRSL